MTTALPSSAVPVWSAYLAMVATKQRHLDYLQHLEENYRRYDQPSAAETARLNELLQAHATQVSAFTSAMQTLKAADPAAAAALIAALKAHSAGLYAGSTGRA